MYGWLGAMTAMYEILIFLCTMQFYIFEHRRAECLENYIMAEKMTLLNVQLYRTYTTKPPAIENMNINQINVMRDLYQELCDMSNVKLIYLE